MLACGSYIRFRSSIFLSLPSPLLDSEASSVPQQRSALDENANPAGRIPRSIREVERRNTIAGIALPPPPPRRGTILGGGGTGRCTEIKIGSVDVTGRRRGGPLVSRQRSSITRRNRRQARDARSMRPPRPFEAETTVHDDDDDDGDGRTNRRLRGKHSEYIRRAAVRFFLESPPPSGGERVAGSAGPSELRIFSLRADREWSGEMLSPSPFFCSFVGDSQSGGICMNRILLKGKEFRQFFGQKNFGTNKF